MLYDQANGNLLQRVINSSKELQLPDDSGLTSRLCIVIFRTIIRDSHHKRTMYNQGNNKIYKMIKEES